MPSQVGENKSMVVLVHDMTNYEHILWEYVWEGVPWPHPEKVVDRGLAMQNASSGFFSLNSDGSFGDPMGTQINCHQFDGVHTVSRSSLLAGRYRWSDVRTMCERFLQGDDRAGPATMPTKIGPLIQLRAVV